MRTEANYGSGSSTTSVGLYADGTGGPGSLITDLGTFSDSSLQASPTLEDISLDTDAALAADTRYWVGLTPDPGSGALWGYTDQSDSDVDVDSEFYYSPSLGERNNGDGPQGMLVTETDTTASPEPTSLWLTICGMVAFGLMARRRMASGQA